MQKATISSGVAKYSGSFGQQEAKHLLNRALFGPLKSEVDQFAQLTLDQAVDQLLDESEVTDNYPLVNSFKDDADETIAAGQTWINAAVDADNNGRRNSLYAWTVGQMIDQNPTFREKMGLFFFNHIPVQSTIYSALGLYRYHEFFKDNYMGNLKDIVKHVCVDYAMLKFLDGKDNKASAPNENFARELLELFTIGKGPQIGDGDYTHYTEDDVKAASRVMTGWKIDWQAATSYFHTKDHDTGDKQFSSAFNNTVIQDNQELEYQDLVDMIFTQKECARFFVRKLYRFFVHYHIDSTVEFQVIEPLATTLYDGGYELKPVYEQLFKSQHFFDAQIQGGLISSHIEYVIKCYRQLEIQLPSVAEVDKRFIVLQRNFYRLLSEMGQELGNPPSVAGWQAYYTAPSFHRKWIDSVSFPMRQGIGLSVAIGYSKTQENISYSVELNVDAVKAVISDMDNIPLMVQELSQWLLPIDLPSSTLNTMSANYQGYLTLNPGATEREKLTIIVQALITMPEYQLI